MQRGKVLAFVMGLGAAGLLAAILLSWLALRKGDSPEDHAAHAPPPTQAPGGLPGAVGQTSPEALPGAPPASPKLPSGAFEGSPAYTGPVRDRERADALRETLATLLAGQLQIQGDSAEVPSIPPPEGDGNQADKPQGRYVQQMMQEQFVPLASGCYEQLLERSPGAAGNVVLDFSIMGDAAVGGVVVDVELGEDTTINDTEFATCMRESMYSVVFDAPPPGHPTLTVKQSFELAP